MSDNTKVVQQAYEAFGAATFLRCCSYWMAMSMTSRVPPHGGHFSGPSGVGKFLRDRRQLANLVVDVEAVGDLGRDTVVGIVRADARAWREAGGSAVHVFTVDMGKITRFRDYVRT